MDKPLADEGAVVHSVFLDQIKVNIDIRVDHVGILHVFEELSVEVEVLFIVAVAEAGERHFEVSELSQF